MSQWVLPTSPAPPVVQSASGVGVAGDKPDNTKRAREVLGSISPRMGAPSSSGSPTPAPIATNGGLRGSLGRRSDMEIRVERYSVSELISGPQRDAGHPNDSNLGQSISTTSDPNTTLTNIIPTDYPPTPTPNPRSKTVLFTTDQYYSRVKPKQLSPTFI